MKHTLNSTLNLCMSPICFIPYWTYWCSGRVYAGMDKIHQCFYFKIVTTFYVEGILDKTFDTVFGVIV